MDIEPTFRSLVTPYAPDRADSLWDEIRTAYTARGRHYHTLPHLAHMIAGLQAVKPQVRDWDTLLFSVFYHDIVYDAASKKNEARSADIAEKRLRGIGYPETSIAKCRLQILATRHHTPADPDTDLLTDADLAVLGAEPERYALYVQDIRKEYAMYPDFLYNPGRRNVLRHFLSMERIFKSMHFFGLYEERARTNIASELARL